jgi:hypothetical protein
MIQNNEQLHQTFELLEGMYRALAALREKFSSNPKLFLLMAEGPLEQIRRLQQQIEEYAGIPELRSDQEPPMR